MRLHNGMLVLNKSKQALLAWTKFFSLWRCKYKQIKANDVVFVTNLVISCVTIKSLINFKQKLKLSTDTLNFTD